MTSSELPAETGTPAWLQRLRLMVNVEHHEVLLMLSAFAMFFLMLCGYYILRPIRESCSVIVSLAGGKAAVGQLFFVVFIVMLLAVPVFGWLVANVRRRILLPVIFGFFISNILLFWFAMGPSDAERSQPVLQSLFGGSARSWDPSWAQFFFVWVGVYNLFTPSLFWSLMSDVFKTEQAKRLFGFVAAGGTLGGIAGSMVVTNFAATLGPSNLLLLTIACLVAAILFSLVMRKLALKPADEGQHSVAQAGVFEGAWKVLTTPFMLYIALYVFIGNAVTTYFYLEQQHWVGQTFTDAAARQAFFANRDLAVNLLTVALELFVIGRLMQAYGVLPSLTILPLSACVGLIIYTLSPSMETIAAVMVMERTLAYAISNPALKVCWTSVHPDDKYRCQNFVDTVVSRGGDASSGTVFSGLSKVVAGLGAASGMVAIAALPLALLWTYTGRSLAKQHAAKPEGVYP